MYKKWISFLLYLFLLPCCARSQSSIGEIKVSEVLDKDMIRLVPAFMIDANQSFHDTVRLGFTLINDTGADTTLMYMEGYHEWVKFIAVPDREGAPVIHKITGSKWYGEIPYEYIYYASQPIRLKAGTNYHCSFNYHGNAYRPATKAPKLLSVEGYKEGLIVAKKFYYTNHIITYFFLGAIAFGFFFFFFLYLKSKYKLFGIYSAFLFMQTLYGLYQVDIYTAVGQFFVKRAYWDHFFGELVVFTGQALWVQFMILWMDIRQNNRTAYKVFNVISIFFFTYAILFTLLYHINESNKLLMYMQGGIRLATFPIQLIVFYFIIFKIRTPVKSYVITGSLLIIFFGVIVVFLNKAGWFTGYYLNNLDNGSWYMIGLLAECICFSMGLGLRYFHMDQENVKLHQENITALQDKLTFEREVYEKEKALADVNQELTNQQLTALRAQMNPHFIFNALNSIQKYIVKGSVDEANSYLAKFSKLQRMILSHCDQNFITLDKEIDMLRLYLEIEQLRLTHEFTFDITVDEEIEPEEIPIPPMMIQPFAENAIWHGLLPKAGEKTLRIHFGLAGEDLMKCVVEDNGVGRKESQKVKEEKQLDKTVNRSKGMSLVYDRIRILERKYGRRFAVRITDKMDKDDNSLGTTVEVDIPVVD